MNVAPNEQYEAVLDASESGLVGTVGMFVHDNVSTVVTAFSDADVRELENPPGTPTGVYAAVRTAPPLVGDYTIVWQRGDGGDTFGTDDLKVEARLREGGIVAVAGNAPNYITFDEMRESLELENASFASTDIERTIAAACRGIDGVCNRRFYMDEGVENVRYYSPYLSQSLDIDDLIVCTEVACDPTGAGAFAPWVENVNYVLEPLNAPANSRPFETLRTMGVVGYGDLGMRNWQPRSVRVTGQFGWPVVPAGVMTAATILAHRLLRRRREAPFGIVAIGLDTGAVMRIAKSDPDVMFALGGGLIRETALA